MAPKPPPTGRDLDEEVSFSWPGQQRRRPDPGVLEARVAQRRQRQAQPAPEVREQPQEPASAPAPAPPKAQPPARREDVELASRTDRWIVTELRRQAVSNEASLREINERLDQLSRTMRQVVEFLPRLQQRMPAADAGVSAPGGAGARQHADAVLAHRIDELEA